MVFAFLQASTQALRAGAAFVYPVTIRVQAVLHVLGAKGNSVRFGKVPRLLPGVNLFLEQLQIADIPFVLQTGMAQLVQEALDIVRLICVIIEYLSMLGRPAVCPAWSKHKCRVVDA